MTRGLAEPPGVGSGASESESNRTSSLSAGALSPFLFGVLLFAVNNLNLLRAWIHPPPGMQAMYVARVPDIAAHLTWINGLKDHWLAPDFSAPFITSPGLFSPLMWILGQATRLHIDSALTYTGAQFLLYLAGAYALFRCLHIFTTSRAQALGVLLCTLCVLPAHSFLETVRSLRQARVGGVPAGFLLPVDGFILQGPLTLTVGTVSVLVSLALLGSYVQSGKKSTLVALGAAAGLSGLLHPFEIFTIMAASILSFVCVEWPQFRRAATHALGVCIPGVLALLPYAYLSFHSDWMRRVTTMNQPSAADLYQVLMELGLPAAAALTFLVVGRMRKPLDVVLQSWFVATLVTVEIPGLPFRWHILDGFAIVTALLLVRQFSTLSFLKARLARRYAFAAAGVVLTFSVLVQGAYRYLTLRHFEESSCSPQEEASTLAWLRRYASPDQLVLAPLESAAWMTTAPIHTFASHWLYSITFREQVKLARTFYSGTLDADDAQRFLERYGVNYVIAPSGGPAIRILDPRRRVAQFGSWFLYYFPENRMRTYSDFK